MSRNKFDINETLKKESQFNFTSFIRLLKYVFPYKKLLFITILLTLISGFIGILSPYITKIVIDDIIPNKDVFKLIIYSLLFLFSICLESLISRIKSRNTNKIGQSVIKALRKDIFLHLQKLPFGYYDNRPHGKILIRVVNYVNSLNELMSKGIINLFSDIFILILILITMLTINIRLTLASIAFFPILLFVTFLIKIKARKAWQINSAKQSNLNAYIHESICGIKITQSFAKEENNFSILHRVGSEAKDAWLNCCKISFLMQPAVDNIATWTASFVYIMSIIMLTNEQAISIGIIVLFTSYIWRFWTPITNITNLYNDIIVNMAYIERIFETMDEEVTVEDIPNAIEMPTIKGDLEFKNVYFKYDTGKNILNNINFKFKAGDNISLVGPTGSGKTTVINLINRFYNINSGQILIDNIDISKVTLNSLRNQIGVMLQDNFIFSGTIWDNIRYGKLDATKEEVINSAKTVNAHDFIMQMENGYDTFVNERGSRLSAGERQLISFARVLLSNPKILILDEATSSIDTNIEIIVQEGLKNLLKNRTSFIIAHRLSTIKNSNYIMYIDNGEIREIGNHSQLMNNKGYYYNLYKSQYKFLKDAI